MAQLLSIKALHNKTLNELRATKAAHETLLSDLESGRDTDSVVIRELRKTVNDLQTGTT